MSSIRENMEHQRFVVNQHFRETDANSPASTKTDSSAQRPNPSTQVPSVFGGRMASSRECLSGPGLLINETEFSIAPRDFWSPVPRPLRECPGRPSSTILQSCTHSTEEKKVSFTKEQYLAEFKKLTDQMLDLTTKKNADYGSTTDPFANFRTFGELGILVRMSDKFSRLRTALYEKREFQVNNETVEDTALDLAVYALLLISYRRGAN